MFQTQEGWYNDEFYQTQYRILQSRSLAKRTIDAMKLCGTPRARQRPRAEGRRSASAGCSGAPSARRRRWRRRRSRPGRRRRRRPAPDRRRTKPRRSRRGSTSFSAASRSTPVRNSRIVEILYTSSDPVFAAAAANAVAKAYIEQNMEFKFSASKDAADWLDGAAGRAAQARSRRARRRCRRTRRGTAPSRSPTARRTSSSSG